MNSNRLSSIKTIEIEKWPHETSRSRRLTMRVGIGLSAAILSLCFAIKPLSSHTVNRPSCHSEHHNDKLTRISTEVRQCKECGQVKDPSAFASKGRDRPSALCKECDNHRRRSTYSPKEVATDWDQVAIVLEPGPDHELDTAKLVLELLEEFHLQGPTQHQETSIVDSIIVGGTSFDDLIRS